MKLKELLPDQTISERLTDVEIVRVAAAAGAERGVMVFATDEITMREAVRSDAGAILVPEKLQGLGIDDGRFIWVADARLCFSVAAKKLGDAMREAGEVHCSAVIGSGVRMGAGCAVGAGAVIEEGVLLGEECIIGPRVVVYAGTRLGDRVVVQAGAVLGSTGFGYARDGRTGRYVLFPQQGTLVVEDDVEIGANTTIDKGALGETRIGAGTKIDNLVHVGHNCSIGQHVIIAAQTGISGSSVIEDGAILGGQVGVGEHATVGRGVILGGGAGVLTGKKMQGAGQVFWGRPARPLKEYLRDLARLRRE